MSTTESSSYCKCLCALSFAQNRIFFLTVNVNWSKLKLGTTQLKNSHMTNTVERSGAWVRITQVNTQEVCNQILTVSRIAVKLMCSLLCFGVEGFSDIFSIFSSIDLVTAFILMRRIFKDDNLNHHNDDSVAITQCNTWASYFIKMLIIIKNNTQSVHN